MSEDAVRLLARVRQLKSPRYPDAYKLLGSHERAMAAVHELVELGLLEHRNNGALRLRSRMEMADG